MVYRVTGHPEPLLYVKWENNLNSSPGWKWEKSEHTLLNSVGVQGPWNHIASFLTFTHFLLFCSLCLINDFHMYFEFNECIRDSLFSIVITLQFKNTMQFLFFLLERRNEHSGYQLLLCLGICFIQEVFQKKKIVRFCAPAVIHGRTNSNIFLMLWKLQGKKKLENKYGLSILGRFLLGRFFFFFFLLLSWSIYNKKTKNLYFFFSLMYS